MMLPGGVELTIKERKSGLHVGRMQVTHDAERVTRSVVLPVCASLLLLHLYGDSDAPGKGWSLLQRKHRFTEDLLADITMDDQSHRTPQQGVQTSNQADGNCCR
jgi:hypothetical protein